MIKESPNGGIRVGGKNYQAGAPLPEPARARDPARGSKDIPPNFGRLPIPQVITFQGMTTSLSKAYRYSDEAIRHSVENAHMMLNDPVIAGPLFARQQMVCLLNYSIESEDDSDPKLKAVADELDAIVKRTPDFTEYRRCLSDAVWYGRSAVQSAIGYHVNRKGIRRRVVRTWKPISGDKLLFRFDDGSGDFDPDQVGIRVSPALGKPDNLAGDRKLEVTGEGMAYFLQPWERKHFAIHKHMIRDGEYEDPLSGGQIHGVGLRNFLYWVWWQKQETLAQIAEVIERTGMGFTIYRYPSGNETARQEVEKVSREQSHTNTILMPSDETDDYRVEQIPPNTSGLTVLHDIVENYYGDMIVRFILGQTLSSKPSGTGMNSGVSELQKDTLFQIARYDAVKLEETLTREFLLPLRDWNFPSYRNVDFKFLISTKVSAPEQELQAIKQLWDMGAKINATEIFDRLDLAIPGDKDETLFNPQIRQQIDQIQQAAQMGGQPGNPMAGGMPGGAGQPVDTGGGQMPGQNPEEMPPEGEGAGDGQPDQNAAEKQRLFGPVLYSKGAIADRIAAAVKDTNTTPTDQQRKTGNYSKGRFWVRGLEIAIENPRGSKRKPEWQPLACHYGYIVRHSDGGSVAAPDGKDGDKVDVYLGPDLDSEIVYVIDQVTAGGRFDEHKCVLFCRNESQAKELYLANYPSSWHCGEIHALTWDQFRDWLENGDTTAPMAKQALKYAKQLGFVFDDAPPPRHNPPGTFAEHFVGETMVKDGKEYVLNEAHRWSDPDKKESSNDSPDARQAAATEAPTAPADDRGGSDLRRQPVDGRSGGPGDRGADRVAPPEERIVTSRRDKTSPADRSKIPARLREHLDDHQQEGVAKAIASLDGTGGFLLADGTGLGKTREQLAIAQKYLDDGKKVLVIAPKAVTKIDWKKNTLSGSWKNDSGVMGIPLNITRDAILPGVVNVSTYENLGKLKELVDGETVLILDESHALKNRDSARSKHGMDMVEKSHAVVFSTATPIDKVEHLHYLDRAGVFGGKYYGSTYEQLGLEQVDQHVGGGQTVKKWRIRPGVRASEVMRRVSGLFDRLTQDGLMIKRELSLDGVPVEVMPVKLPAEAHDLMDRIEREITGSMPNPGLETALIRMQQRRQQEPFKIPMVIDDAIKELEAGRQVVIFASRVNESRIGDEDDEDAIHSEGTMKTLYEELQKRGIPAEQIAQIHGGMKPAQIPKEMDRFQAGGAKVVIATLESGGTGINLDDTVGDRPRTLYMMTAPFSAVENVQGIGRVWRLKTKSMPRIKFLFADTEVDDWNAALISKKMKTLGASISGQIGKLDVSKFTEDDVREAIDYEPEEPYEWKYPGEGQPLAATFSRLDDGGWGLRVDGRAKPGDVVEVTTKDGRRDKKTIGRVLRKGRGFTLASISDARPAVKREELPPPPPRETPAKVISPEKKEAIHQAIRAVASMDEDRAKEINGMGFNKFDGQFGHALAAEEQLTDRQAEAAEKLVTKYKGQLPTELVAVATKKEPQPEPPKPVAPKSSHPFESLAAWSEPKTVSTHQGKRVVRSAYPTGKFWDAWRKDKESLKKQGISVSKYQGDWQVSWWTESPEKHAKRHGKMIADKYEKDNKGQPLSGPDKNCNCDSEPLKYAENGGGASKWVPFTGPRGGKGWQNLETMEVYYGEQQPGSGGGGKSEPASERPTPVGPPIQSPAKPPAPEQEPRKPAPTKPGTPTAGGGEKPKESNWHRVGSGMGKTAWRHRHTGEVVLSHNPPDHGVEDTIAKARAGGPAKPPTKPEPKPAAQPRPADQPAEGAPAEEQQPADSGNPPPDPRKATRARARQLDSLPDGTKIAGWTKESVLGQGMWTKGAMAMSHREMVDKHGDQLDQAVPPAAQPQPAGGGPGGKASDVRDFTDDERDVVGRVGGLFGIRPGDLQNDKQTRVFLLRTARNVGFDPDSIQGDKADRAIAAAQYLEQQHPKLEGLMKIAEGYGWKRGTGRETAHSARHAGLHLLNTARAHGFQPGSATEHENVADAINFLGHREQHKADQQGQRGQAIRDTMQELAKHFGPIKPKHLALAAAGFFLGYMMIRHMRKKRQRRYF